jgi:hypothetical protein
VGFGVPLEELELAILEQPDNTNTSNTLSIPDKNHLFVSAIPQNTNFSFFSRIRAIPPRIHNLRIF